MTFIADLWNKTKDVGASIMPVSPEQNRTTVKRDAPKDGPTAPATIAGVPLKWILVGGAGLAVWLYLRKR